MLIIFVNNQDCHIVRNEKNRFDNNGTELIIATLLDNDGSELILSEVIFLGLS